MFVTVCMMCGHTGTRLLVFKFVSSNKVSVASQRCGLVYFLCPCWVRATSKCSRIGGIIYRVIFEIECNILDIRGDSAAFIF